MTFGSGGPASTSALVCARVRKLEAAMDGLREDMQPQAQDMIGLATGFARTDSRVFVQNTAIAAVHYAQVQ